ncbi:MAG TPA: TonB family protein, partial [Rhodocyclaceae bacterium]
GSLVVTVTIKSDGSIKDVIVDRPSGFKVLDEAARNIIRLAAPYAAFPPNIARDTDEIVITRMWSFTKDDRLQGGN